MSVRKKKRALFIDEPRRSIDCFELEEKSIGEGRYGSVFLACDPCTGKKVAIKKLFSEGENRIKQKSLDMLRTREAEILRSFQHPNVVKLYELVDPVDMTKDKGILYMVMEALSHDLRGIMENPRFSRYISRGQVKGYIQQLLSGVAYCHSRKVMHRDLKPENILLSQDGFLKLADFGLACVDDPRRYGHYTNPVVSLMYRSPELILGAREYAFAVDTWSVGLIAAELMLNSILFPGSSENEQLELIWKVCGTPLEHGWNEAPTLPLWKHYAPTAPIVRDLKRRFQTENKGSRRSFFTDGAVELIDALTQLDPKKRISCASALSLFYFKEEQPTAHEPDMMPRYPSSNFTSTHKRHKGSSSKTANARQ